MSCDNSRAEEVEKQPGVAMAPMNQCAINNRVVLLIPDLALSNIAGSAMW